MSAFINVEALIPSFQVLFMCAQPSDLTEIPKVHVSSKYEPQRLTFKYSIDLFIFICITDWSAALFVLYLHHFSTVSDVLRCIRKVSQTSF